MTADGESLREALSGGDRRSIGDSDRIPPASAEDAHLFAAAVAAMADPDPVVRMRAADSVEKASRTRPALLAPHKHRLLGSIAAMDQQEVRWHLLQMLPRLPLNEAERQGAAAFAERNLASKSRIAAAEALSALFALAQQDPRLGTRARAAARQALESPSPALRARARKLLERWA